MVYIDSKSTDARFNFALEKYLMYNLDISDSYFLFWRTTPTLSIGKFQDPSDEINLDFAKKHHIPIVRRLTGGGSVYLDKGGWQFSYITKHFDSGEIDFVTFTTSIKDALKKIGINVYNSGRNDLLFYGKKISGNAQFKSNAVILHHGTLLFNSDLDTLAKALSGERDSKNSFKTVRNRVANISEYLIESMSSEAFRDLMVSHLTQEMTPYSLKKQDVKKINQIKADVFDNHDWTYGTLEKCNVEKEKACTGGTLKTKIYVKNDRIKDIRFYGDFFEQNDINLLRVSLIDCPYNKTEVLKALDKINADNYLYHITKQDMLDVII